MEKEEKEEKEDKQKDNSFSWGVTFIDISAVKMVALQWANYLSTSILTEKPGS